MKTLTLLLSLLLSGCGLARYSHTSPSGETRSFWAVSLGSTTAIKDLAWKVGDSDLHVGEAQQQQPLAESLGVIVGAAVKAAK